MFTYIYIRILAFYLIYNIHDIVDTPIKGYNSWLTTNEKNVVYSSIHYLSLTTSSKAIHKRKRNTVLGTSSFYPVYGKLLVAKYISDSVLQISSLGPLLQKMFDDKQKCPYNVECRLA